jgi:hypothetical protein
VELVPCPPALEAHTGRQVEIIEESNAARSEADGIVGDQGLSSVCQIKALGCNGCEDDRLAACHRLEDLDPSATTVAEWGDHDACHAIERVQTRRVGYEVDSRVPRERQHFVAGTSPSYDQACSGPLITDPWEDLADEPLQRVDVDLVAKRTDEEQRRIGSELVGVLGSWNRVRHDVDTRGHWPRETPLAL